MSHKTFAIGGLLALAAGASAQLTSVSSFTSTYQETFGEFTQYYNTSGSYSTLPIMGGEATFTSANSVMNQLNLYSPSHGVNFGVNGDVNVVGSLTGLGLFNFGDPVDVTLTFSAPVDYFGGYFADLTGQPETVIFLNAAGNSVGTESIGNGTDKLSWDGWYSSSGISSVQFTGGLATAMDDLQAGNQAFATPEPGAYAVMGLGVLGLLLRRRR